MQYSKYFILYFCYKIVDIKSCNTFKVGGYSSEGLSNSAEVFDYNTQKWHMISRMSTRRVKFGVGVLNNLLYAVK